jgi:hypothetical protein
MYFLAIPLTIITYIKCIAVLYYLPLLAIFRDAPEPTTPVAPGLQINGLLLGLDNLSLGVSDLLEDLRELIFSDGQLSLTHSLLIQLLLVLVIVANERNHFHAESWGDWLKWWILRAVEAAWLVIGAHRGLVVIEGVLAHQ